LIIEGEARRTTCGFMLLGLDQQTSTKSTASLQFRFDKRL
jgi:hypothetical protein